MRRNSVLKWPGGYASSGKAASITGIIKLPAAQGTAPATHPGYSAVLPPGAEDWEDELLDLTSLGSAVVTGLSVRKKPVVVQFLDLVIWCNGIDAVKVYDPVTKTAFSLGIAVPSAAPGLADTGSGSFAGEYTYAIQWKRSVTGETSPISALGQHTASGSGTHIAVTWTDPSLSGVDLCNIYRSKTGHVGLYLVHADVDITDESKNDNTADESIDITLIAPDRPSPGASGTIPVFDYIAVYQQRLWGLIDNKLYWSEPNAPWLIASTSYLSLPNERDTGSGFAKAHGSLYVSQERHLYYLASLDMMEGIGGKPILVPSVREGDEATGFASQHAVTKVENGLEFISGEGKVYSLPSPAGPVAQEIGAGIEGTLKRLFTKRLADCEAGYAEHERKVYFAVSTGREVHNDVTLVHDLVNGGFILGPPMEALAEFRDSDGRGRLCFGNVRGDINQIGVGHGHGARAGTLSGSATVAKNVLTDTSAAFNTAVAGLPIACFDSRWNLKQTNYIASRTSATVLKCLWDLHPATAYYVIGGSFPEWAFGWFDLGNYGIVKEIILKYAKGHGKFGIYQAYDDGEFELADTVNQAEGGLAHVVLMEGGYRFRTKLQSFAGASDLRLVSIEWDVEPVQGAM